MSGSEGRLCLWYAVLKKLFPAKVSCQLANISRLVCRLHNTWIHNMRTVVIFGMATIQFIFWLSFTFKLTEFEFCVIRKIPENKMYENQDGGTSDCDDQPSWIHASLIAVLWCYVIPVWSNWLAQGVVTLVSVHVLENLRNRSMKNNWSCYIFFFFTITCFTEYSWGKKYTPPIEGALLLERPQSLIVFIVCTQTHSTIEWQPDVFVVFPHRLRMKICR